MEAAPILEFKADPQTIIDLTQKLYQKNFFSIWTREVVQNSVDALSENVEIFNDYNADQDRTQMRVVDDGTGMTDDIIYNAFLALGGTRKESNQAVGGFGIAKTIVLAGNDFGPSPFEASVKWYVTTTVEENKKRVTYYFDSEMMGKEGVRIIETRKKSGTEIVIYRKGYAHNDDFLHVLENCNVPASLFFNESPIVQLERARKKEKLSWATIYYKKKCFDHQEHRVIVRINGIYQFDRYVTSRMVGVAIVEIETESKPTDEDYPLTPNREQIKQRFQNQMEPMLEEFKSPDIVKDDRPYTFERIFNPYFKQEDMDMNFDFKEKRYRELKMRKLTPEERKEEKTWEQQNQSEGIEEEPDWNVEEMETYKSKQHEEEKKRGQMIQMQKVWNELNKQKNSLKVQKPDRTESEQSFHFAISDIAIKRDRGVKTNVDLFNPINLKALYCMQTFIEMIFKVASRRICRFNYHIGWTISNKTRAEYLRENGDVYILLSPIGLKITDTRIFTANVVQRLVHEMIHHEYHYHDESFIATFHAVMEESINPHIREFERMAKKILKSS